jgi:hypothetical protein
LGHDLDDRAFGEVQLVFVDLLVIGKDCVLLEQDWLRNGLDSLDGLLGVLDEWIWPNRATPTTSTRVVTSDTAASSRPVGRLDFSASSVGGAMSSVVGSKN